MKRYIAIIILLSFTLSFSLVPVKIVYKGRLTDANNKVLNGTYDMIFRIYDGGCNSDCSECTGTKLTDDTVSVEVNDGYFHHVIDLSSVSLEKLNKQLFLEIWVKYGDFERLCPRETLYTRAPYTIWARSSAVAETANVVGSGAVSTDAPITGDGTASSPITLSYGGGLTLSGTALIIAFDNSTIDTNSAGKIRVKPGGITSTEIDNGVVFSSIQNSSGTEQFTVTDGNTALQFAASGMNSVSFNSSSHRITYTATASVNAPITGNGTSGSPLGLNYSTGLTLSGSSLIIDENNIPYTPSDLTDWNGSADPGDVDDGLDQLADRVKSIEGGNNTNYIQNQYGTAQSANFWINGKGKASRLIATDTLFLNNVLKIYLSGNTVYYASDSVLDFGGGLIIEKDNDVKVNADLYIPSASVNSSAETLLAITGGKVEKILKSSVTAGVSSITGGLGLNPDATTEGDVVMTVDMTELRLKGLVATTYDSLRVKVDGNTICFGGSNELKVCTGGISTTHISDGTIVDNDISATANIAWSKINKSGSSINDLGDVSASGAATGALLYYNGSSWIDLSPGTSGYVLRTNGTGSAPSWSTLSTLSAGDGLTYVSGGPYDGTNDLTLKVDIADASLTIIGGGLAVTHGSPVATSSNFKLYNNH